MAATFDGDVADIEAVRMAMGSPRVAVIGYDYYAGVAAAWAATHTQAITRLIQLSPIEPADSLSRTWSPPERVARLDTTAARALVKARAAGKDTSDAAGYCEQFWRVNMRLFVNDTVRANAGDSWQTGCGSKSRGCPGVGAADQRRTGALAEQRGSPAAPGSGIDRCGEHQRFPGRPLAAARGTTLKQIADFRLQISDCRLRSRS